MFDARLSYSFDRAVLCKIIRAILCDYSEQPRKELPTFAKSRLIITLFLPHTGEQTLAHSAASASLGSESAFAAYAPDVRYADRPRPSNMNWRLALEPIRLRRLQSASNGQSQFLASVRDLYPAKSPKPAWGHGRPTSPHAHLCSSDTPSQ